MSKNSLLTLPTIRQTAGYLLFPARMLARPEHRRHALRWVASLRPGGLLRNAQPWLAFDAIDYLDRVDMRGWRVFEYGSGGSTLYWLRRGASVTSVEHDAAWHERVRQRVPPGASLDYRLVPAEPALPPPACPDPADPQAYLSIHYPKNGLSYRRYVTQIDSFADGSLDLVLVDGRARTSCLAHAAAKVRPGGMLILDNSERAHYTLRNGAALAGYTPIVFAGAGPLVPVFSQTTIYIRA
jgi:hypothetical protein